jgi:hypothetical protein
MSASYKVAEVYDCGFRVSLVLVLFTALIGFSVFCVLNPGMMSFDSIVLYEMSNGGRLTDHHPAIYPLLLRLLRRAWDSPAVMVAWNVGIFSFGSLLIGDVVRSYYGKAAYIVPLTILLPFILNFIGVLWVDVVLATSWWSACAIGLYIVRERQTKSVLSPLAIHGFMTIAYLLFLLGLLVRHNSVFGAPFLLIALLTLHYRPPATWLGMARYTIVATLLTVLALATLTKVIDWWFNVVKTNIETSLIVYDLAGITKYSDVNAFPIKYSEPQVRQIENCYQENAWDIYATKCRFVVETLMDQGWWGSRSLWFYWIKEVVTHPYQYLRHRIGVFFSLMRIGHSTSYYVVHNAIEKNDIGLSRPDTPLFIGFGKYIGYFADSPVMKPFFWLLFSALLLWIWLARFRFETAAVTGAAVATSALVYSGSYLVIGIASDFRYVYWSIMACIVSLIILLLDRRGQAFAPHIRHIVVTSPIALALFCVTMIALQYGPRYWS